MFTYSKLIKRQTHTGQLIGTTNVLQTSTCDVGLALLPSDWYSQFLQVFFYAMTLVDYQDG